MGDTPQQPGPSDAATAGEEFRSPAYLERRRRAIEQTDQAAGFQGMDLGDPRLPAGHASAIRTSTRLTSDFRRRYRKGAMDITPQEVIEVLHSAAVKSWVLMGLHGYIGYMPEPRATQDVDVMVPSGAKTRATKAILARWPALEVLEFSQVTRFLDPADLDSEGRPKPVIDLMYPWSPFQQLILEEYVIVERDTHHRLPTLEAALVSKYAAMISPHREHDNRQQDAVDFRRLVKANRDRIRSDDLRRLAALVWEGGADEVERFIRLALADQPFPL